MAESIFTTSKLAEITLGDGTFAVTEGLAL